MDTLKQYSSFEGRVSSISEKPGLVQAKLVGLNGGSIVLAKIDPGLPVIKAAARGRERVICIFEKYPGMEELCVVGAVFVSPKGWHRKMLLEEIKLLQSATITLYEFLTKAHEFSTSFYGNQRLL